ncbi:MMPL family transporter [Mycobacteroides abscessus subsp. abscessus]|uniref:MMPL family transporter n=1 Tax=Mycobacteroides abscessus TaxID=36809 RepID=UPI0019D17BC9|nr:MMPL family transporter [Mycobacteroides abscessus]MBN7534178.1 MMPL family transporter [Mycobacteroides abscessus subsp. abscessus]
MAHSDHPALRTVSRFSWRRPWLVIGSWLAVLVILNLGIPQLETTVAKHSAPFMPSNTQAAHTFQYMSERFGVPASSAIGSIVLVDEQGINEGDRRVYRQLVDALRADTENVAYMLDAYTSENLRDIGLSPDGKAINLALAGTGDIGTTKAHENTVRIRQMIDGLPKPPGLDIYLTGPSPTLADMFSAMDSSLLVITAVSIVLITLVLLAVYRSLVTAMVPLITIGIALGVARPVISLLGEHGVLLVSNFTISLMTALLLGAATDYAIFIVASYHEGRRAKLSVSQALRQGSSKVNGILAASALTIAVAASAMAFTELGMFKAAGPPIAIAIVLALAVSLTLPYAILSILGTRGYAEPRHLNELRWRRTGARIIRHAGALSAACIVFLLAAASVVATFRVNFRESSMLLNDTESTTGYAKVRAHWGVNDAAPEYLVVTSATDMRNTDDLAALDHIATAISALPDIAYVRSITRPAGKPLTETTTGYQAGVIGRRLEEAQQRIAQSRPDLGRLASGLAQLQGGADTAAANAPRLVAGTRQVVELARTIISSYESAGQALSTATNSTADIPQTLADLTGLVDVLDRSLQALSANAFTADAVNTLGSVLGPALTPEPIPACTTNPICAHARAQLDELDSISNGATTRVLRQFLASTAVPQEGIQSARLALPRVKDALARLQSLSKQLGSQSPAQVRKQLDELVQGAATLAQGVSRLSGGIAQVKGGVDQISGLTGELNNGLEEASGYLNNIGAHTSAGPGAGFYLPPQGFTDKQFVAGQELLFSPDGKTARMLVVFDVEPDSYRALNTAHQLASAATQAAVGTSLRNAQFASTGLASLSADMRDQVWRDFATYGVVAMLGVFLVLAVLLRSLLAPLFMVAVVTLSFAAAAGITILFWQHIIGVDVDWSVFPVSFMALIAVGADYSMLFAARIREESHDGMVRGILRGFGSTGSVITTAGLVFALTMFALMSGSVINLLQIGFTIGVGLLLDITIVRTVLVPAAMSIIGNKIWWPSTL